MAAPATGYANATLTNPSGALTAFSLIVDLADMPADWWTANNTTDGTKGRVFNDDGTTELAVDWINFDNATDTGWIRVNRDVASSGTQTIRIYPPVAANSSVAITDTFGGENAYNANWDGYWPLDEASGTIVDRTSNSNDLTANNTPTYSATGKVGKAIDFEQDNDEFLEGVSGILDAPLTLMIWCNAESVGGSSNHRRMICLYNSSDTAKRSVIGWYDPSTTLRYNPNDGSNITVDQTGVQSTGDWRHIVVTESGSSQLLYADGSQLATTGSNSLSWSANNLNKIRIAKSGHESGGTANFDGIMDEAQVHSVVLSATWISTEYSQTNDNSAFWSSGWAWNAVAAGITRSLISQPRISIFA